VKKKIRSLFPRSYVIKINSKINLNKTNDNKKYSSQLFNDVLPVFSGDWNIEFYNPDTHIMHISLKSLISQYDFNLICLLE